MIAGSKTNKFKAKVWNILKQEITKKDTIIHSNSWGIDRYASEYCKKYKINETIIEPLLKNRYEYYHFKNCEMIGMADRIIIFLIQKSRGIDFIIKYSQQRGKQIKIYNL